MNTILSELPTTLALGTLGWQQIVVLGLLGVLIFGKRLPEVGKSLGKGIVEFKKGLSGIDTELEDTASAAKQLDRSTTPPPPAESQAADVHAESKVEN